MGKPLTISKTFRLRNICTMHLGDCNELLEDIPDESIDLIVTSPPYCMGKPYEKSTDNLETFALQHRSLMPKLARVLKPGGSLCWQVGYHVHDGVLTPLDFVVYDIIAHHEDVSVSKDLVLRNRIAWTFGHGLNATKRFSGRHETILWYTKGNEYSFDLDSVRIPQKYPGKRYYKGPRKGEYSCNTSGKNPSDVWDIPNVKANHVEKTTHPCQFPLAIPQRLIRALTPANGLVLDPFMGSGTSAAAAILEGRRFVGAELNEEYYNVAKQRARQAGDGTLRYRKDVPVIKPDPNTAVARPPERKKTHGESDEGEIKAET